MDLNPWLLQLRHRWNLPLALQWTNLGLGLGLCLLSGLLVGNLLQTALPAPKSAPPRYSPPAELKGDEAQPFSKFEASITYNLFGVELGQEPTAPKDNQEPQGDLSSLLSQLELKGVYQGQPKLAVLVDRQTGQQRVLAEQEVSDEPEFHQGLKVVAIEGDLDGARVKLALGTKEAWLEMNRSGSSSGPVTSASRGNDAEGASPQPSKAASTNGKDFYVSSEEVDSQLNNLPTLLNQARVVPYFGENGKTHEGYMIKAIDSGSLYEKLGLQNNDVIQRINGDAIDSPEKAFNMLKMLRNERQITLNLKRGGEAKTLVYHIN
ncbi:MAG: hypothetical protein A2600_09015 [Candidatus Lambdaproteobacteria bacterium RIFOXYD1_FULL_56_27]|uniref:PDZ domain-containing protein n=1 Tax=Candidatus Lambdaproteobacteria bacterium RIFOXYD2_FULL_56_26 TaxID=1817773 RepID=A0A1F6GYV2_9PROT|nr:MAG: hypothetical protein A2426_10435 [Candidatus Lambdaproteobacteria bacterium RIFOXYC1_FULL_56_13]OGH03325.1 MAG: hypothetical protein A2557_02250 [Candidatus Lambdaproteobacteria bacterium RIFOXYD2_FULL_56_26]OGH06670.1 MAG: hypothetical protein A2600_09015 [Candidatus Lambdaproteobacteria bacterium RIFOXYD1_FULL_56_27]